LKYLAADDEVAREIRLFSFSDEMIMPQASLFFCELLHTCDFLQNFSAVAPLSQ
jgi:hypothetical protein